MADVKYYVHGNKGELVLPKRSHAKKGQSKRQRMLLPNSAPKAKPVFASEPAVKAIKRQVIERFCKDGKLRWFYGGTSSLVPVIGCNELGTDILG